MISANRKLQPLLAALLFAIPSVFSVAQEAPQWKTHDMWRPRLPKVAPAHTPASPPADAIVLFDGRDLRHWRGAEGGAAPWLVKEGAMIAVPDAGSIQSKQSFGDVQLHIEWSAPVDSNEQGQARGNSGVFLMSKYEIQVLDSHDNRTYTDGIAASVYGQSPPLVDASLPAGQWQTFDIVFRRPRFHRLGQLKTPARVTVFHNGLLVQDNVELAGPTRWLNHLPYEYHPPRLPLALQNHGSAVRFRNIWVRELRETTPPGPDEAGEEAEVALTPSEIEVLVGKYRAEDSDTDDGCEIVLVNGLPRASFYGAPPIELVPRSATEMALRGTDAKLVFELGSEGKVRGVRFHVGVGRRWMERVR